MLRQIIFFESRYYLRQALFWVCLLVFMGITFASVATDEISIGTPNWNANRNAPFVIVEAFLVDSILGMFLVLAFVANGIHRDYEHRTYPIFFTTRVRRSHYVLGRFLGGLLVCAIPYLGMALALFVGSRMPWLEPERVGAFQLAPYVFGFLVYVVPNLLLMGALFHCIASLTRSLPYTYAGLAGFLALYTVGGMLLQSIESAGIGSFVDPFGAAAFYKATSYWTVAEKNGAIPALSGAVLANRLGVVCAAFGILTFTVARFRMKEPPAPGGADGARGPGASVAVSPSRRLPPVRQSLRPNDIAGAYLHRVKIELSMILRGLPFLVLVCIGLLQVLINTRYTDPHGSALYPVTHLMLESIRNGFSFVIVVLTLYSGEVAWRERAANLGGVIDALPVPTGVLWSAKLTALLLSLCIILTASGAATIGSQLWQGYHHIEPLLYAKGLFLQLGPPLAQVVVLAFLCQVLTGNKMFGYLLTLLYYVGDLVLPVEHNLLLYANSPSVRYSDMNGYGDYGAALFWFRLYWSMLAGLFVVAVHLLWQRGSETRFALRWRIATQRATRRLLVVMAFLGAAFLGAGGYIFYNTNVLNRYRSERDQELLAAEFEQKYRPIEKIPQPRIVDIQTEVDLYPSRRMASISGTYQLANKTSNPIPDLHVMLDPEIKVLRMEIPGAGLFEEDTVHGYRRYRLNPPLAAGATIQMKFAVRLACHGFVNGKADKRVVANGSFLDNLSAFPHLGYSRGHELHDPSLRKAYGLPPVERLAKVSDLAARATNPSSPDADWLTFQATVSTDADQIAIAPGDLQREWTSDGRRYFHYKMSTPALNFFSIVSARYQVRKDRWRNVAIEIYYHEPHSYNIDRMVRAVKLSLDYFTTNFGPYQHKVVRIAEIPRYTRGAQSFPTMIVCAEDAAFIRDHRQSRNHGLDDELYGPAHELAHQWWGDQVVGANVQGCKMLSETLAEYSALMVMEREYGAEGMRRILAEERDGYFSGRSSEGVAEMPLALTESQYYVDYNKGGLVMYALRDAIGEQAVNRALAAFLRKEAFQGPPYATSLDLIDFLRNAAPPEKRNLIEDLFEQITLYDLRTTQAVATRRTDGSYSVKLSIDARKLRADGQGRESAIGIDDWIDIGVMADGGSGSDRFLFLEKRHITQPRTEIELLLKERPARVGVDPGNKLLDRNPDDNVVAVLLGDS